MKTNEAKVKPSNSEIEMMETIDKLMSESSSDDGQEIKLRKVELKASFPSERQARFFWGWGTEQRDGLTCPEIVTDHGISTVCFSRYEVGDFSGIGVYGSSYKRKARELGGTVVVTVKDF